MDNDISRVMRLTNLTFWFLKAKNTMEFISIGVVGSLWMSLLLIFIWTGNLLLLKIWATPIAFAAVIASVITGLEALRKNKEINIKEHNKYFMSRDELKTTLNSLAQFNDYEIKVEPNQELYPRPSYDEYKEFVLSIKPKLDTNENLIKLWYMMFENGKWSNAGFNIRDWKELTTKILSGIDNQLEQYLNFYLIKQSQKHNNESGTNKI